MEKMKRSNLVRNRNTCIENGRPLLVEMAKRVFNVIARALFVKVCKSSGCICQNDVVILYEDKMTAAMLEISESWRTYPA